MGIIRSSKDQALVAGGPKVANDKGKQKDESLMKKEQSNEPSGSKRSKKNGVITYIVARLPYSIFQIQYIFQLDLLHMRC